MTTNHPIYLDYASTTPVDQLVIEEMLPFFRHIFGNASSKDHISGDSARNAVEIARHRVAALLDAESDEIYFTSGATEAINLGIVGYYLKNRAKGNHIITAATEHKAVLETIKYLENIGANVTYLKVDNLGEIELLELTNCISDETIMVSLMHTNNETGIIQKVTDIANICHERGTTFFCDTSQAIGKLDLNLSNLPIDLLCISGHKMYGPKGIGALYIRRGIEIEPIMHGGGQEKNIRPGTYNTPLIVGLGKACEIAKKELDFNYKRVTEVKNFIEDFFIKNNIGDVLSSKKGRTPYISSVTLKNETAEEFILKNREYISISSGSACNSEIVEPSHVILSMVDDHSIADRTIRLSYSKYINIEDVKNVMPRLK